MSVVSEEKEMSTVGEVVSYEKSEFDVGRSQWGRCIRTLTSLKLFWAPRLATRGGGTVYICGYDTVARLPRQGAELSDRVRTVQC